jgi:hypothetical protein
MEYCTNFKAQPQSSPFCFLHFLQFLKYYPVISLQMGFSLIAGTSLSELPIELGYFFLLLLMMLKSPTTNEDTLVIII